MLEYAVFPLQEGTTMTELIAVGVTFLVLFAFLAGSVMVILRAYRARAADEELRYRVATLEEEVERLHERLDDRE
ncbi:hypothetical protein [Natronobiforma cellulositropha]|uniref:hypothetical protein n=1 Tax=Natronobiforma cellulositropha TaxID=1679076 RepID=UPI0021D5A373|nr:hypothetical protein [Natronobiforma cellulositropha]